MTALLLLGAVVSVGCTIQIFRQQLWETGVAVVTESGVKPVKEGKGEWTLRLEAEDGPARLHFAHDGSERHDLEEAEARRGEYPEGSEVVIRVDPSGGGVVHPLDRPLWLRAIVFVVILFGVVYADSWGGLVAGHLRGIDAVHGVEEREPHLVTLVGPETTCLGFVLAFGLACASAIQGWPGLLGTVAGVAFPAWISIRVVRALSFWKTWDRLVPSGEADWDEALAGPVEIALHDLDASSVETRARGLFLVEESRLLDSGSACSGRGSVQTR
jgi:hypothetical protein